MSKVYRSVKVWAVAETDCYANLNVPIEWSDQDVYEYARHSMDGSEFVEADGFNGDWTIQSTIIDQPYNPDLPTVNKEIE